MMIIGFIGLGKMGKNMVLNLLSKNIRIVVYNRSTDPTIELGKKGAITAFSIKEFISKLQEGKKIIWLMVPSYSVDSIINELKIYLTKGDIIIDGGNSYYKDSMKRNRELKEIGVSFMDVGTNNGVEGALHGSCLTIGGEEKVYESLRYLFSSMSVKDGYIYTGQPGSGHYVKMVHNIIEYGMMQSIGEGFEALYHSGYNFNLKEIAKLWSHGSVIRSWLMELTERSLSKDQSLEKVEGIIEDTGEGKWAILESLEKGIPMPASSIALMNRYRSREKDLIAEKLVASLRKEFGNHQLKNIEPEAKPKEVKKSKKVKHSVSKKKIVKKTVKSKSKPKKKKR